MPAAATVRRGGALLIGMCLSAALSIASDKNARMLSHTSVCLGKEQHVNVYTPPTPGPHSVLYLLHGFAGRFSDWAERTDVEAIVDQFNLIVVMPDGGYASWYADSPLSPPSLYESYVVKELVPLIDSVFSTHRDRRGRGICGLSMGGYGAIKFGLKYPHLFSSASSLSGVLAIARHPVSWSMPSIFGDLRDSAVRWQENDLLPLVVDYARGAHDSVALKFDTGIGDFVLSDNRLFLQRLQELGIAFEYAEFPGGHDWHYWGRHIREHLEFHRRNLLP